MTPEQAREERRAWPFSSPPGSGHPVPMPMPEDITVTASGGEPVSGEWGQVQYMPGLEERVAALEAGGFGQHRVRVLPPGPVLTREVVEAALRECVTVVKPGETLVIRCRDWTPKQAEQCEEYLNAPWRETPFRVLVVIGDELAVVRPESDREEC